MKEFNYERAWREYVKPEFEKLSGMVHLLFVQTATVVDSLGQARDLSLVGQTPELVAAFDAVPVEELAWASQVIYYYGHLAPDRTAQSGGLYWKFQKLADASIINRDVTALHEAKTRMEQALKSFDDHKEGTEYDNDELPKFLTELLPELATVVEILKADYVNHKPHPFCIGLRHFPKDGGIYINPRQAPCAMRGCNLSYDEHTSERALFVRPLTEEPAVSVALKKIVDTCKQNFIKLDGFGLVK